MKKTGLCIILAAALLFASCGSGSSAGNGAPDTAVGSAENAPAPGGTEGAQADKGAEAAKGSRAVWEMQFDNGTSIPLGGEAAPVLSSLGDPTDLMEAPSCIREGFDRVYTFGGAFTLTTAPDADGADIITEVTLLSDAVAVVENGVTVMIGSPVSDADAAFGEPTDATDFVRRYSIPGGTLAVTVSGEEITGISAGTGV